MGFFGKLFFTFLAVVVLLAVIGFIMRRRDVKKGLVSPEDDEILSQKTAENVLDLNDRFNRARYMDEDGK